jgi:hypothetical protein
LILAVSAASIFAAMTSDAFHTTVSRLRHFSSG